MHRDELAAQLGHDDGPADLVEAEQAREDLHAELLAQLLEELGSSQAEVKELLKAKVSLQGRLLLPHRHAPGTPQEAYGCMPSRLQQHIFSVHSGTADRYLGYLLCHALPPQLAYVLRQ